MLVDCQSDGQRGSTLTKEQRANISGPYYVAWMFSPLIEFFLGRYGEALHIALPWLTLAIVVRYPREFTLLPLPYRGGPLPLTLPWLVTAAFVASPAFVKLGGSRSQFLWPALCIGSVLFLAVVVVRVATAPEKKDHLVVQFSVLLVLSVMYYYGAASELNAIFDRSPDRVYHAKVLNKSRGSGTRGLAVGPWGPVTGGLRCGQS